ncbi:MAG: hypothetical protein JXP34_03010 [Planctomycetes bacterium]|nr:hypothetical protein [Planctomycetota bacterium]
MRRAVFAAMLVGSTLFAAEEKVGERQETKLEITATAGFGGVAPRRGWIPVWVRIRAPKGGFEGTIEARASSGFLLAPDPVRRPIEVAAGTRAEFFVAVPPFGIFSESESSGGTGSFSVRDIEIGVSLIDRKGRTQAQVSATTPFPRQDSPALDVIVEGEPPARVARAEDERPGARARLPLRRLPTAWQALDGIDRLIVRADSAEIEAAAARIRDWVLGGGTCAVTIPRGPTGIGPALQDLMGAGVGAGFDVAPQALGATPGPSRVIACELFPRSGTRSRTSADGRVVAVERTLGAGRVLAFGFDVEAVGGQAWLGPAPDAAASETSRGSKDLARLLADFRGFIALPLWLVTAIFVGYILLIGPVEYLVLRAIGRTRWTWITLPVTAVAFFILIHRITAYRRAGGIEGRAIAVAVVDPAAGRAVLRSRAKIYSPLAFRAEIDSPLRGAALCVQPERSDWGGFVSFLGQAAEPLDLDPARGWVLRDVVFRTSATRTFEIDWSGPAAEAFDLRLEDAGTLLNAGPAAIDEVWAIQGGRLRRLEGLAPGERLDIEDAFRREDAAPAEVPHDPDAPETRRARFRRRSREILLQAAGGRSAGVRSLLASLGRILPDPPGPGGPSGTGEARLLFGLARAGPDFLRVDGAAVPGERAVLIQVVLP